eukprot:CAMPEP_0113577178 /NCGR_PEP_ID=MMETSP0015_2-20120614/28731_1 /TAXON_ID=2838 /ORGANISM="Odontella" /LENGTH=38 /DNA_ID=CAMNT_0000480743 /DNA_START=127 /DNA_END=239 /DNA_ORIENTATION=- /assembly_acc=CAM_ASM_000160
MRLSDAAALLVPLAAASLTLALPPPCRAFSIRAPPPPP